MAKRKISGIINATEHPMNLETPWNQKQPDGTYHAYAGDDIEAFLKKELSNRTPTEELVGGETAMDRILHALFNRELDPMYPYLTYQDFLNACGLAEEDLNLD